MNPRHSFEELSIPRKDLPKMGSRYRVYRDARNFVTVEADSALEALTRSGVQQAYRIERDAIYLINVINLEQLSNRPPPSAEAVAESPKEPPPAQVQAPPPPAPEPPAAMPSAAAEDAPLSTADIDKLLSGNATGA